jgi:hypothetical protein
MTPIIKIHGQRDCFGQRTVHRGKKLMFQTVKNVKASNYFLFYDQLSVSVQQKIDRKIRHLYLQYF